MCVSKDLIEQRKLYVSVSSVTTEELWNSTAALAQGSAQNQKYRTIRIQNLKHYTITFDKDKYEICRLCQKSIKMKNCSTTCLKRQLNQSNKNMRECEKLKKDAKARISGIKLSSSCGCKILVSAALVSLSRLETTRREYAVCVCVALSYGLLEKCAAHNSPSSELRTRNIASTACAKSKSNQQLNKAHFFNVGMFGSKERAQR